MSTTHPHPFSKRPRRARLGLEALEAREVPATLDSATGELLIDHSAEPRPARWAVDVRFVPDMDHSSVDRLVVSEHKEEYLDHLGRWWAFTSTTATFPIADVRSVRVLSGREGDQISLHTLPTSIPVVVAGTGQGRLLVDGGNTTWALTDNRNGSVNGHVQYTGMREIASGSGNDTFVGGNSYLPLLVSAGDGTDTLDLSGRTSGARIDLANYTEFETVLGGSGVDTLESSGRWTLGGTNAGVVDGITFSGFENLAPGPQTTRFVFVPGSRVTGTIGWYNNYSYSFTFDYSLYATPVVIDLIAKTAPGMGRLGDGLQRVVGGSGADRLIASGSWDVTGMNAGLVRVPGYRWVRFSSVEHLKGGSANDDFTIDLAAGVTGTISASDGVDTLDYFGWTIPVAVNLGFGTAAGADRIDGFEIVRGGSAGDRLVGGGRNEVLVGNGGNDDLQGNGGRDILIGGSGADTLSGGAGDDILIAGSTVDASRTSLIALWADWGRTDQGYVARCNLVEGRLAPTNVTQDSDMDRLTGGTERDWFLARYASTFTVIAPTNPDVVTDWAGNVHVFQIGVPDTTERLN